MFSEDPLIGNLIVDAIDTRLQRQRLNVEFAFVLDTTVDTVIADLEEALSAMDLRLVIPRAHCALAFDSSASARDAPGGSEAIGSFDASAVDGAGPVLVNTDRIFAAPEVEAFYSLNRRCGIDRTATFFVIRHDAAEAPMQQQQTTKLPQGKGKSQEHEHTRQSSSPPLQLAALLLPRPPQADLSVGAADSHIYTSGTEHMCTAAYTYGDRYLSGDEEGNESLLAHVRSLVAAESAAVARGAVHWSARLSRPATCRDWLSAVDAESAACDRLAKHFAQDTAAAAAHHATAAHALQSEVTELQERVEGAKAHVARRAALQERAAELKAELDAQRLKERELLHIVHDTQQGSAHAEPQHVSPALQEEIRRALTPRRRADLRQLAGELGQHMREPNPSVAERQRLIEEVRHVRREVERQRMAERPAEVSPMRYHLEG